MSVSGCTFEEARAHSEERTRIRKAADAIEGHPPETWPAFDVSWDLDQSSFYRVYDGADPDSVDTDEFVLIPDVEAHCHDFCKKLQPPRSWYGVMFPKEKLAGQTIENLQLGVYYTPLDSDQAHSDLTFTGNVPQEKTAEHDKLVIELSKKFNAIHPDQITLLPDANLTNDPQVSLLSQIKAAVLAVIHRTK